jgi:hypothetical protein
MISENEEKALRLLEEARQMFAKGCKMVELMVQIDCAINCLKMDKGKE